MSQLIPTRWSHLLGYSGVGALVRADEVLFTIMDIGHWTDRYGRPAGEPLRYVDLLRATMEIDRELIQPPLARVLQNGGVEGTCVPAVRFPRWTRCPHCGVLHHNPWEPAPSPNQLVESPKCQCARLPKRDRASSENETHAPPLLRPNPRLQQVAWVLVHPEGGLDEVPWHFLAHLGSKGSQDCREDRNQAYLRLRRDRETGLYWRLRCDRCGAENRFDPRLELPMRNPVNQPWSRQDTRSELPSKQPSLIMEVSDSRVYLPLVRAALVIPPESRIQSGSVLDLLYCDRQARTSLEHARSSFQKKRELVKLADRFGCATEEIEYAWTEIGKGWPLYGEAVTPGHLLAKEYRALREPIPDLSEGEDFVPYHRTEAWRALEPRAGSPWAAVLEAVDCLVAVARLREIRIFRGFSRVAQGFEDGMRPTNAEKGEAKESVGHLVPPDLDFSQDWLPAIELYGEGIFFTLSEDLLTRWTKQPGLVRRAEILQQRLERTGLRIPEELPLPLTPRFLLLHTLAHLLIRQLETQAGYPAASLRERIYCAESSSPMAGILVYVAVPDLVGSLGGLAELAEPERFLRLLTSVFEHADWCSLDPVCAEHQGQGPSQLNLAACHACALTPDTSCAYGNLLLDRTFVKGDLVGDVQSLLEFAAGR